MQFSVFEIFITLFSSILIVLALANFLNQLLSGWLFQALKNKRMGGLFILLVILCFICLTQLRHSGFLLNKDFISLTIGLILILLFGTLDDLKKMSWKYQISIQSLLALILILAGDSIQHIRLPQGEVIFPGILIGIVLTYFWLIIIINSLNWIDGIDGLAGTVSLITFGTLGFLSLTEKVNQPSTAHLCFAMFFLLILFLAFNLPPARFYLGTVGIWTLGFLITTVSLYSGGKVATTALVLSIPIFDFVLVSLERILKGRAPVFGGDRLHLHQRLIACGWPAWKVTLFLGAVTAALGIGALIFQTANKIFLFLPIALLFFALALLLLRTQKPTKKR